MTVHFRIYFWTFFMVLFWGCIQKVQAQEYTISKIDITGNKHTKALVILQEIDLEVGHVLHVDALENAKTLNEKRLYNLGIFNNVHIEFTQQDDLKLHVLIDVIENWYIYPALIFELADRNFSEWWTNNNRALNRINYGVRLTHINLTGYRDKLNATFQLGYTRKYELKYMFPYLDKTKRWSMHAFGYYATQKEVAYNTVNNKTQYAKYEDKTLVKRFRTGFGLHYRPNLFAFHTFGLEYHKNAVDPYVTEFLNPNYYLNNRSSIRFFYFNYHFTYDKRIYPFYPEGGYCLEYDFKKFGFKIFDEFNNLSNWLRLEKYVKITPSIVTGLVGKIKINLDRNPVSFANNYALGWNDNNIIGYNLYVIDGTDYGFLSHMIRWKFLDKTWDLGDFMLKQFRMLNVQLNARFNTELAYVHEPTYFKNNPFSNTLLFGYGPALDVILYNNHLLRFQYGFNHIGEGRYAFDYKVAF